MTAASLSRRDLMAGAFGACVGGVAVARNDGAGGLIEPIMRLARPAAGGLDVALSLDACPGAFDDRIARALVAWSIPATIFVTGAWMRRNPAALDFLLAHRDLFALENHGDRHLPPVLGERRIFGIASAGTLDAIRREVLTGAADITVASGRRPRWYRAATGFYSPEALSPIRRLGFAPAGYSLNGDMGAALPARQVAARIGGAVNGDVIVSHINQPRRTSGLGVVEGVGALRGRGARFLRLDTLTAADVVYSQ